MSVYKCVHDSKCDNQTITRFRPEDIHLNIVETENRGYGVETSCAIIKDQAIIEVIGKVILGRDPKVSFCSLN